MLLPRHPLLPVLRNSRLEAAVEFLPRPRQPGLSPADHWLRPKPAKMAPLIAGPDKRVSFDYHFAVPKHATGPLLVTVRLRYRKANQFFMNAIYPRQDHHAPITDMGSASAQITIGGGTPARRLRKTSFLPGKLKARNP
jgi:hypothetical protein